VICDRRTFVFGVNGGGGSAGNADIDDGDDDDDELDSVRCGGGGCRPTDAFAATVVFGRFGSVCNIAPPLRTIFAAGFCSLRPNSNQIPDVSAPP
jgi:hypothetical protein